MSSSFRVGSSPDIQPWPREINVLVILCDFSELALCQQVGEKTSLFLKSHLPSHKVTSFLVSPILTVILIETKWWYWWCCHSGARLSGYSGPFSLAEHCPRVHAGLVCTSARVQAALWQWKAVRVISLGYGGHFVSTTHSSISSCETGDVLWLVFWM